VGAGTTIGVVSLGIFEDKLRHTRIQCILAAVCMTTFIGAMAATNQHHQSLALAMTFLGSYSVGAVDIVTMTTAPLVCAPEDIGLAAGELSLRYRSSSQVANIV
jgi:predicted MFS family arabinose efflux permease